MDNASFHKTRKTRELIEESGHELLFLPPFFLPISTQLKNTSQTSKKFALISRQKLLSTTLFDCTELNDFYYIDDVLQGGACHSLNLDGLGKTLSFYVLMMKVRVYQRYFPQRRRRATIRHACYGKGVRS